MFEVGKEYANRIGKYTVLKISGQRMQVRYSNGSVADLNMAIQERIWQNIVDEREAAKRKIARRLEHSIMDAKLYVRSISVADAEDRSILALRERMSIMELDAPDVKQGDRFIFYSVEDKVFFAVATVTGPAIETRRKAVALKAGDSDTILLVPLDWDVQARTLETGVSLDSVELESQPNFRKLLQKVETYLLVNEDDFELLAELLTEATEEEIEEEEEEEEEEEQEV